MKKLVDGMVAVLLGIAALSSPNIASAAVIGEYNACGAENLSAPVTATGNTWVQVTTVNAAALQNLDVLIYRNCNGYLSTPAVDAAIAGGMGLVVDFHGFLELPGNPGFYFSNEGRCALNVSIVPSSPVASGPGGTLTNDSLDVGGPGGSAQGVCSIMGSAAIDSLPAGVTPFVTTLDGQGAAALGYSLGAGRVAVSYTQWSFMDAYTPSSYLYSGIKTYLLNAANWAMKRPVQTCASEGYKGTQLTWCKNICESGLTGKALDTWIQRWISKYRELPYCAVD